MSKPIWALCFCSALSSAQVTPLPQISANGQKLPIKVNIINVCTPTETGRKEIASALSEVPFKANFTTEFEVTRGRTDSVDTGPARYIRLRREVSGNAIFNTVQYSLSNDSKNTQEILVFKTKDPKDLLLISIEDEISASAASPKAALDVDTPASRISLERFGKPSLVLAKCANADQTAYQSLFDQATKLMAGYRKSLSLRGMFRNELTWLVTASAKTDSPSAKPRGNKGRMNSSGMEPVKRK